MIEKGHIQYENGETKITGPADKVEKHIQADLITKDRLAEKNVELKKQEQDFKFKIKVIHIFVISFTTFFLSKQLSSPLSSIKEKIRQVIPSVYDKPNQQVPVNYWMILKKILHKKKGLQDIRSKHRIPYSINLPIYKSPLKSKKNRFLISKFSLKDIFLRLSESTPLTNDSNNILYYSCNNYIQLT